MNEALIIRQTAGHRFRVMRPNGKAAPEVALDAPDALAVAGRPDSHLPADLGWYLERSLEAPFPPDTELAEPHPGPGRARALGRERIALLEQAPTPERFDAGAVPTLVVILFLLRYPDRLGESAPLVVRRNKR